MDFEIKKSIEVLSRTPTVLEQLLKGLSADWLMNNEGEGTWSPYDIVGHLIHGEKTDWIPRARIILSNKEDKTFEPFDRFAQMEVVQKPIEDLLEEFKILRTQNIEELKALNLSEDDFSKTGIHPELGEANLKGLLASWLVHDLGHIAQVSRVMAKQYKSEVGPWKAYLTILKN